MIEVGAVLTQMIDLEMHLMYLVTTSYITITVDSEAIWCYKSSRLASLGWEEFIFWTWDGQKEPIDVITGHFQYNNDSL